MRLPRVRQVEIMGAYLPSTVLGLVGLTFAGTLGAMLLRGALPLLSAGALVPGLVLQGQLWRLVTWPFLEPDPLNFVFGCLLLAMLGRDLSYAWGPWRFVGRYFAIAAGVGAATSLFSIGWSTLAGYPYLTMWALGDALLVAWAIQFPSRQILVYLVIPLSGRNLIYATVGATAILSIFQGSLVPYVPHFLAMGSMLALARYPSLSLLWVRVRLALERRRPKRESPLRVVRREGDEPPRWLH